MSTFPHEIPSSALSSAGKINTLKALLWCLRAGVVAIVLILVFVPWQQSIRGQGRVIAYAPLDRQQVVEAPIDGRVVDWYVQEGDRVEGGQRLARLSDNDEQILARLRRERDAAQAQVDAAALSISLAETRIASLESANLSALENAKLRVQMATDSREAKVRAQDAADAASRTALLNQTRQQRLHERGLSSTRDLELADLEAQTSRAELDRAKAALRAANAEIRALSAEQAEIGASNKAKIESARTSLEKLRAERAKAQATLAQVEVRLARQAQMDIVAPRTGTILRLVAKQDTEMVKAGDALLLLVPEAGSRAVELYVDGRDAPLVDEGCPVRLQFEGWPAVQFAGWPSVAVGTFSGRVAFVDAHDDGYGRFRVVIVPGGGEPWPDGRYLRQGVRANGWVLLNRVTLGFELWRQFNGFPPAVSPPKDSSFYGARTKS